MDENKIISKLIENSLVIDCKRIALSQNGNGQEMYCGPGSIYQNQEGFFEVKIFCSGKIHPSRVMEPFSGFSPGVFINKNEYFSFIAQDLNDISWVAEGILPNFHTGLRFEDYIVFGQFENLYCQDEIPYKVQNSFLNLYYREKVTMPCNVTSSVQKDIGGVRRETLTALDTAKFSACEIEIEIHSSDRGMKLTATSNKHSINESIIQRIHETLQFVLAKNLKWSAMTVVKGNVQEIHLRSMFKDLNNVNSLVQPPIAIRGVVDRNGNIWKLFEKFLFHLIDLKNRNWSPIFILIHKIIEASKASSEAYALTLSVAVEGLLKQEFSKTATLSKEFLDEIEKAWEVITNAALDANLKNRIIGSLGAMKRPRASDRLYELHRENLIEEHLIKSWESLRHSSAHSDNIDLSKLQEHLNNCNSVCVLFYQLIFLSIGYTGNYTDYSSEGWPDRYFKKLISHNQL